MRFVLCSFSASGIVYAVYEMIQHTTECANCSDNPPACSCTAALSHALSAWASALLFEAATLPVIYYCAFKQPCMCCIHSSCVRGDVIFNNSLDYIYYILIT
jgi:hypothetical protein